MKVPVNKIPKNKELQIIKLYNKGWSSTQLSKKYNIHYSTIFNILKRNGYKARSQIDAKRKFVYNDKFFSNINSEEKAYWLGFILTDGCISDRGKWKKDLIITIKDKGHLKKFVKSIKGNNKIYKVYNNGREYESLSIRNQNLVKDLISLGITPKKSLTVKCPLILDNLQKHFWRGVIDGDGTMGFYTNKKRYNHFSFNIGLCGNQYICKAFCDFVIKNLGIELKFYPMKSIFSVRTTNNKAAKIAKLLYKNTQIYLKRKQKLYLKSLKYKWQVRSVNSS